MNRTLTEALHLRLVLASLTRPRVRDERGDVPGWVLVTVMSVALVMGIWSVAEPQLKEMLSAALGRVR